MLIQWEKKKNKDYFGHTFLTDKKFWVWFKRLAATLDMTRGVVEKTL